MITKHLDYYIDLADKAEAKYKRIGFNFERNAIKQHFMLQMEVCHINGATLLLSYFKKLLELPQPSAVTTLISQHSSASGRTFFQQKDYDSSKVEMIISNF